MRGRENVRDGGIFVQHIQVGGGLANRLARFLGCQRSDFREFKQALRIRFGVTHLPAQLRESGAHQCNGETSLGAAMECGDEYGELRLRHILEFVDEEDQCGFRALGRCTDRFKQGLQIVLQITVIGETGFRFEIEPHFDIVILHLQCLREPGERAERPLRSFFGLFVTTQAEQCKAQLGREQGG